MPMAGNGVIQLMQPIHARVALVAHQDGAVSVGQGVRIDAAAPQPVRQGDSGRQRPWRRSRRRGGARVIHILVFALVFNLAEWIHAGRNGIS
jgi:hypothetical protein